MPNLKCNKTAGFTLLEVIVAVTILGTGLVIVIGLFSSGLRSATLSNDYSRALFLARKKLGEIEIKGRFSANSGKFETEEYSKYEWKIETSSYSIPIDPESKVIPRVIRAKVTIMWKEGKREKKVELETLKTVL